MTIELQILAWSVVLGFMYLSLATAAKTRVHGAKWNASSRDAEVPALTGVPARLDRAFQNFKETFPFFVAAVMVSEFVSRTTGKQNHLSAVGAHLYFWARIAYIPLYVTGIPYVRSLVWIVSAIGILLVLSTAVVSA